VGFGLPPIKRNSSYLLLVGVDKAIADQNFGKKVSSIDLSVKILTRISVSGISMVSVCLSVWCLVVVVCSGKWLVGPCRTSNRATSFFI
jgi:hypothetical protein